jgi:hypothetical protein
MLVKYASLVTSVFAILTMTLVGAERGDFRRNLVGYHECPQLQEP